MKTNDERVMVVPTAGLLGERPLQGLRAGGEEYREYVFAGRAARYLARAEAETDPAWKQIIPYVVLACGEEVCVYRRGKRSGEARLATMHSVGFGGHIRQEDESLFAAAGRAAYEEAMRRELAEEVELPEGSPVEDRLVAVINDDSSEVGRVHFGLVHIWTLAEPRVRSREDKITGVRFAAPAALLSAGIELESWSRLCLENWAAISAR